jgi:hypothetical protein
LKKTILILCLGILALYVPHILLPINEIDTGWDFSHAFTFWRGKYFWSDYIDGSVQYLYGLIIAPFAFFFPGPYLPTVFYATTAWVLGLYLIKKGRNPLVTILLALALLFDHTLHLQRPEIFILLCAIGLEPWLFKNHEPEFKLLIPVGLIMLLIHPSASFIAIIGLFLYHQPKLLYSKWPVILLLAVVIFLISYLNIYPDSYYAKHLMSRLTSGTQIRNFIKFLTYSGVTFIGFMLIARKILNIRFLSLFGILLTVTTLISGYYYYSLLLVPFILYILYSTESSWIKKHTWYLAALVAFNAAITVVHPIFTLAENPKFAEQVSTINRIISTKNYKNLVYSEHSFGGALYDHLPNARTMVYQKDKLIYLSDNLYKNDVLYSYSKAKLSTLKAHLDNTHINYKTQQILLPVKGNLQLSKAYRHRTDSLGLWQTTIL